MFLSSRLSVIRTAIPKNTKTTSLLTPLHLHRTFATDEKPPKPSSSSSSSSSTSPTSRTPITNTPIASKTSSNQNPYYQSNAKRDTDNNNNNDSSSFTKDKRRASAKQMNFDQDKADLKYIQSLTPEQFETELMEDTRPAIDLANRIRGFAEPDVNKGMKRMNEGAEEVPYLAQDDSGLEGKNIGYRPPALMIPPHALRTGMYESAMLNWMDSTPNFLDPTPDDTKGMFNQRLKNRKEAIPLDPEDLRFTSLALLRMYVSDNGSILHRRQTGLGAKDQRKITRLIKKARMIGLIPFVGGWVVEEGGGSVKVLGKV